MKDGNGNPINPVYEFYIGIKNIGKSPAKDVRAAAELFRTKNIMVRTDVCESDDAILYMSSKKFVFPDANSEIGVVPVNSLSQEPRTNRYPHGNFTLLSGCVTYYDSKNKLHRSSFTYDLRSEAEMTTKEPFAVEELFGAD